MAKKYIHVNQHKIRANKKHGTDEPVITIKEGRKNVHAFVVGYRPSVFTAEEWDVYYIQGKTWRDVTYNPYKNTTFVYKDTGEPVGNDMTMVKLMTKEGRPLIKVYS